MFGVPPHDLVCLPQFDRYDGDGIAVGNERGSLDTREIEALISDMDIQMTNEQLQEAIQVMDADQEGTVSLDEFMEVTLSARDFSYFRTAGAAIVHYPWR